MSRGSVLPIVITVFVAACGSGGTGSGTGGRAGSPAAGSGATAGTVAASGGSAGSAAAGVGGGASAHGPGGAGGEGPMCAAARTLSCPAVDGTKIVAMLSGTDQAAFCDCLAVYGGGYGAPLSCTCSAGSPGALGAPASQSACLATPFPAGCPITVSQYIACMNLTYANPCDAAALAAALSNANCMPLATRACH